MSIKGIKAKVSKLALFTNSPPVSQLEFQDDTLNIVLKSEQPKSAIEGRNVRKVSSRPQLLHTRLKLTTHAGEDYSIGGLNNKQAELLHEALLQSINNHRDSAQLLAKGLSKSIMESNRRAKLLLSPDNYLRHTTTVEAIQKAVSRSTGNHGFAEEFLSAEAKQALEHIRELTKPEGLEPEREGSNRLFVESEKAPVKAAAHDISKHVLTDEQARAVATDEKVTLVLAGAGTGKTAVISAKIGHLVRNQGAAPDRILAALAFNRDAAQEIRDRLQPELQGTKVLTFHASGSKL